MSNTTFEIAGHEYNVVKKGIAQAEQVTRLGAWLAQYGTQAYRAVNASDEKAQGIEIVGVILQQFTPQALIELFSMIFGCTTEVAEAEFDIATLVDGCVSIYENSSSIQRLVSRFFSGKVSTATPTDTSTQ